MNYGDKVRLQSGDTATVESVEEIQLDEPIKVYNFEVEDYHTYYVSEHEVLVHNMCAETVDKAALYQVGLYSEIKGAKGLDAHHVGQKSVMKDLVDNYDPNKAPAINVPREGHTKSGEIGRLSTKINGFSNARQLLARDFRELRRVYPDIPKSKLKELIELNKKMYPEMRK